MVFVHVKMQTDNGTVRLQLKLYTPKKIMIDCEPFGPRPDTFLPAAIEYTKLKCKAPTNTLFGEWTFDYTEDVTSKEWNSLLPILKTNLERLYDSGSIRFAEWTPHIK